MRSNWMPSSTSGYLPRPYSAMLSMAVKVEAGGDDDGAHLDLGGLRLGVVIDGLRLANVHALAADDRIEAEARVRVEVVARRDGLGEGDEDGAAVVSPTSYSFGTTTGQTGVQSSQILHFSGSTYCALV